MAALLLTDYCSQPLWPWDQGFFFNHFLLNMGRTKCLNETIYKNVCLNLCLYRL